GAHVLGVECSPRQLKKAWAADKVADEEIVEGVGQALPVPDASADVVVFFNSLHHVPAEFMAKSLEEAARVLKPGGLVYISEPLAEGVFYQVCRPIDDEATVRAQAYDALKAAPGFAQAQEFRYIHTVAMKSYEAFRDRIISANSEREAKFERMDAEMRDLFAAKAMMRDGSFCFDQPMRVNVLRKV
ncbi:MAG TPA: class I SAM-dependent methyltransferase, partial [Candidatus Omnitrophota bacterium]|nr:class I SAM-dependent methyltransferase [Candidatus Omnitrophota bacterium]